MLTVRCWRSYK